MLMDRGLVRVRPLKGGLDAWVAAGFKYDQLGAQSVDEPKEKAPA
jgi:hypothetical protein